jgi:uncharacterized protein YbjT (DUF2867 family)
MSDERTIAVVGATGTQGGGLADAILSDPDTGFRVRALTRDPDSDRARQLADEGAEVVRADLDDPESLRAAFQGAHGVFGVTNFWEHFSPEKEQQQARNMAEAARAVGIRHVVWSTLEDMREKVPVTDDRMPTLMERYKVPHYDGKGEADRFFREAGVPTTFFRASFYWDNMIHFGMGPKRGDDGILALVLPMGDSKLPGMAAEDIGKCALGIFRAGDEFIGRTVGVAGEFLTGSEMAEALSEALGERVRYQAVEPDVYRGFGFDGADDLGNMFQVKRDFAEWYCGNRDLDLSRRLNPELLSFNAWLGKYADRISLE